MDGTIFINYRRGEDAGVAGRLYDRLEHLFGSQRLFMDVDNIPPGEDFVAVLEAQVAACDVLLALIGRSWLTVTDETGQRRLDSPDDFVRIEIAAGLAQGKRVIPVLLNDAPMPRANELPEELKPLVRRQAIRVAHDRFKDDAERLARALEKALAKAEAKRQAEKELRRSEEKAKRKAEEEAWRHREAEAEAEAEVKRQAEDEPRKAEDLQAPAQDASSSSSTRSVIRGGNSRSTAGSGSIINSAVATGDHHVTSIESSDNKAAWRNRLRVFSGSAECAQAVRQLASEDARLRRYSILAAAVLTAIFVLLAWAGVESGSGIVFFFVFPFFILFLAGLVSLLFRRTEFYAALILDKERKLGGCGVVLERVDGSRLAVNAVNEASNVLPGEVGAAAVHGKSLRGFKQAS